MGFATVFIFISQSLKMSEKEQNKHEKNLNRPGLAGGGVAAAF